MKNDVTSRGTESCDDSASGGENRELFVAGSDNGVLGSRRDFLKSSGGATAATMLALHGMRVDVLASDPSTSEVHAAQDVKVRYIEAYVDAKSDDTCCDAGSIADFVNATLLAYPVTQPHGGELHSSSGGSIIFNPNTEQIVVDYGSCVHDQPVKWGNMIEEGPNAGKYLMKIKITSTAYYKKVPL